MTTRSLVTRLTSLATACAIATTAGFSKEIPPASGTFPAARIVTDTTGRKLEGAILTKDATSIKFRRTSDGKEFTLELAKLSADDQAFIAGLQAATSQVTPSVTPAATPADPAAPSYTPDPTSPNGKIRILYVGSKTNEGENLSTLQKAGYDVIAMAPVKVRAIIATGDLNILKEYDGVWVQAGGKEYEATNLLMYKEVEKLKRVLVTKDGYANMSKKDLLEGKEPEKKLFKAFVKVTDNFIMFTPTSVSAKGEMTLDETIVPDVIAKLQTAVKTYHR